MNAITMIRSRLFLAALGTLCLAMPVHAGEDFKISGSAGFRIKSEGQRNGRLNQEAALKIETKRNRKGLKAVTKLEADTSDLLVKVDAGYFDLKLSDATKIRGGLQKKETGLESSFSSKHRTAPFKSRSLSQMEIWGFSGKFNQVKVMHETDFANFAVGAGSANSHDSFLTTEITAPVAGASWLHAGVWLLGQADRIDNTYQKAGLASAAFWSELEHFNFELEAAEGTNPHEAEYQKTFGDGRHVRFNYGRIMGLLNINLNSSILQPFLQYEFLRRDHTDPYNNSLAYTGGVNWFYEKDLRLSAAIQSEGAAAGPDQRRRHWSIQQSILQAVYYFD